VTEAVATPLGWLDIAVGAAPAVDKLSSDSA
jgi:hypothetical protein